MYSAVPDSREARGDGSTMGESGRCEGLAGSVASGGRAEPASIQASALDATGNPGWGQVLVTTVRLWLSRRMPRVSIERPDRAASLAAADRAAAGHGPRTAGDAAAGSPSWGQVLATTVRLGLSRRMPRVSIEWQHRDWPGASQAPRPARELGRPADRGVRRSAGAAVPRGSAGAPVPRGSYRRVLAASMLGLGLLA